MRRVSEKILSGGCGGQYKSIINLLPTYASLVPSHPAKPYDMRVINARIRNIKAQKFIWLCTCDCGFRKTSMILPKSTASPACMRPE